MMRMLADSGPRFPRQMLLRCKLRGPAREDLPQHGDKHPAHIRSLGEGQVQAAQACRNEVIDLIPN